MFRRTETFLGGAKVRRPEYENTITAMTERTAGLGFRLIGFTGCDRSPNDGVLRLCEAASIRNGTSLFGRTTSYG